MSHASEPVFSRETINGRHSRRVRSCRHGVGRDVAAAPVRVLVNGRPSELLLRLGHWISPSVDRKRRLVGLRPAASSVFRSLTFEKLLSLVSSQPAAELVDLGPVIGSNITFLGERFGCKIHVADLYADLDRHAEQGLLARFPDFLRKRFAPPDESIDAVLCWDVFDYLDQAAKNVLARELMRMLRPRGALLAFFGTSGPRDMRYTKYVIEDDRHLRCYVYAGACSRRQVLANRDIMKLFTRLRLFDSVVLKSGVREVLLRKPRN